MITSAVQPIFLSTTEQTLPIVTCVVSMFTRDSTQKQVRICKQCNYVLDSPFWNLVLIKYIYLEDEARLLGWRKY